MVYGLNSRRHTEKSHRQPLGYHWTGYAILNVSYSLLSIAFVYANQTLSLRGEGRVRGHMAIGVGISQHHCLCRPYYYLIYTPNTYIEIRKLHISSILKPFQYLQHEIIIIGCWVE